MGEKKGPDESAGRVLTPGGWRPEGNVHAVRPGEAVRAEGESVAVVPRPARPPNQGAPRMTQRLVLTPGGYRHPSLVTRVPRDHAIERHLGRYRLRDLAKQLPVDLPRFSPGPGDVPGFGSGWIAYASWTNATGQPVTAFRTTWRVPPAPVTSSGQTIFLFNGIDPADTTAAILQPVLQWGHSGAGGGPWWSIASWYVTGSGEAFHTDLVPVNEGDSITGVMKLTEKAGATCSYTSEFEGIAGTTLPVLSVAELVWCNETLEAYGITACSDYPNTDLTAMTEIALQTSAGAAPLSWTPTDRVTDCGQHALVASDSASSGTVDLFYRRPRVDLWLENLAEYVQILFGVTNDGGGLVIVNGRVIRIPPRGPIDPIIRAIAEGLADAGRGIAAGVDVAGASLHAQAETIARAAREMTVKGLEKALEGVKRGGE